MSPPIRLCPEGHAACRRHAACPTCAAPLLLHLRHARLEALARAVVAPCENRVRGCDVALGLDALQRHHAVCPRRLAPCPLPPPLCSGWRGLPRDLPAHLRLQHGHRVLEVGIRGLATLLRDVTPHFFLLDDDDAHHCDVFVFRHTLEDARLRVSVHYVGLEDNASNFSFSLQLSSSLGHGVYRASVSPDDDRGSFQGDRTALVDGEEFSRIFGGLDDSQVQFAVKIRRNKFVKDDPKRKKSTKW